MALLTRYLVILLLLLFPQTTQATESISLAEQNIKAGMLYHFLKYTQWPTNAVNDSTPMTVCIFGKDAFADYLTPMQDRTVNRRSIIVQHIDKTKDAENCHLLFVGVGEKKRWPELLTALAGKTVLTVSDLHDFVDAGGMITFSRKGNRIIAELNMQAMEKAHLRVQDRLLKLVTVVNPATHGR